MNPPSVRGGRPSTRLTRAEAAEILSIDVENVRSYDRRGVLAGAIEGGEVTYSRAQVHELAARLRERRARGRIDKPVLRVVFRRFDADWSLQQIAMTTGLAYDRLTLLYEQWLARRAARKPPPPPLDLSLPLPMATSPHGPTPHGLPPYASSYGRGVPAMPGFSTTTPPLSPAQEQVGYDLRAQATHRLYEQKREKRMAALLTETNARQAEGDAIFAASPYGKHMRELEEDRKKWEEEFRRKP